MLVFRKWFLAVALVTLTVAVASAQPAFQCVANAGVPPIVRSEGIAELTGDLVLNCNNGTPTPVGGAVPQANVQIFLNTNITSRVDGDDHSEALLMIDEPVPTDQVLCVAGSTSGISCPVAPWPTAPGLVYKPHGESIRPYNVWQGRKGGDNSIFWLGVPIDAPGTVNTRIIRITNVRANANMLGVSSTLVPNQIIAYISITGSTSIPINNPQQTVAWIQTGLAFSVRKLIDESGAPTLQQCVDNWKDLATDPTKTNYGCYTGKLRFQENFATAFKTRFTNNAWLNGDPQNFPGVIYNGSESGFFANSNWDFGSGWGIPLGQATQGTRLRAVFNNIPAGVTLYVSTRNAYRANAGEARLVNVSQTDSSGAYAEVPSSGTTTLTSGTGACLAWAGGSDIRDNYGRELAQIGVFGGQAWATWEVTNTDPLITSQRLEFGYLLAYKANTANNLPGVGTVTINGMYGPISTVTKMSSTAPSPRFADTSSATNLVKIDPCVTNLLFPFVTNQAGFDTGMVISNTTKDPWDHATQAGVCKLNYYGDTNGGAAPPAQTSAVIPAGDYLIWGLSGGGKFGIAATQGFQGYIIAQCKFQCAHGFAFISDYGNTRTAQGYLALVMDVPAYRNDVAISENLGM